MDENTFLLYLALIGVVIVGCFILFYLLRNPFRAALGTALSSIVILVTGLSLPKFSGESKSVNIDFSPFFDMKLDKLVIESGTPPSIWVTAFVSIVILCIAMGVLLVIENQNKHKS